MEIYGTLGPACAHEETLRAMFEAGMTGVRLNLSHVTLHQARGQIDALHDAAARCGVKTKLLIDMQGPELRIGALDKPLTLHGGDTAVLGAGGIPVPELIRPYLTPGQELLLDDGKILLKVREVRGSSISAEVIRPGELRSRKSIALPGIELHTPAMTDSDRVNIRMAKDYGVTGVMQPFVRSRQDLETVRIALNENGGESIRLFAKIENMQGVDNLEELMPAADEIVIARGDLGNAVELWQLPALQKRIAEKCRQAGKSFMVVTQMLSSMEHSPVPTRAEVSDIFNAVLDGAASVMVTGETAAGEYPVDVIRYLANTAAEGVKYLKTTTGL